MRSILALAIALLSIPIPAAMAAPNAPVVRTTDGLVRGIDNAGVREFLGIPYATAPRWQPPRRPGRWTGVRDATKPGADCAQIGSIATGVPATSTAENCLDLNVYAPAHAENLPVMVWIHGGGFTGGAGRIYDGAPLVRTGNVIVVTLNYRLGSLGYLALPGRSGGLSGEYGLQDQQAALRWVRRNARAFGGDPRDVTIFGESAGGASVCENMASPTAAGLFQRAIAESGCFLPSPTRQQADQQGVAFAARLGCATAACLRTKPVTAILGAAASSGWSPVLGGPTLPVQPISAFAAGRYAHVPFLQGTNHDEGRFFVGLSYDALGHPLTAAQYPGVLTAQFGAVNASKVAARYPLTAFPSPDLAYASVLTDSLFACPALAADFLTARSGVYAYEFSDPNPPNDFGITFSFPLGAAHSTELQYVFGKIPLLDRTPPFTPPQARLSVQMMRYWTHFATTGNPNEAGLPPWSPFTATRPQVQRLVPAAIAPETDFATEHQCALWAQVYGFQI